MPKCEYCGQIPFLTFCASFFAHVERCRHREKYNEDLARKQEKQIEQTLRKELEHQLEVEKLKRENAEKIAKVQKNVYHVQTVVCGDQINITNLYMDYPKTPFFLKAIKMLEEEWRVDDITDLEKDIFDPLQFDASSSNELYGMINGSSKEELSQAYSFLADVARRVREKMEKCPYPKIKLIEEAKLVEKECLESKAQLQV